MKVRPSHLRDSGNSHSILMGWQHLFSEIKGQAVLVRSVFALTEVQKTLLLPRNWRNKTKKPPISCADVYPNQKTASLQSLLLAL